MLPSKIGLMSSIHFLNLLMINIWLAIHLLHAFLFILWLIELRA